MVCSFFCCIRTGFVHVLDQHPPYERNFPENRLLDKVFGRQAKDVYQGHLLSEDDVKELVKET